MLAVDYFHPIRETWLWGWPSAWWFLALPGSFLLPGVALPPFYLKTLCSSGSNLLCGPWRLILLLRKMCPVWRLGTLNVTSVHRTFNGNCTCTFLNTPLPCGLSCFLQGIRVRDTVESCVWLWGLHLLLSLRCSVCEQLLLRHQCV